MNDVYDSLRNYGCRPVSRLLNHGILGEKTMLGHCIHINPAEMDIMKETGTMAVNNPESNMGNAVGCSPVLQMMSEGIMVGMGTDAYTHDMLQSLKVFLVIQRHNACHPNVAWMEAMQMLFEKSYEFEECEGLGFIKGKIDLIEDEEVIKPHMGWNKLCINHENPLIKEESYVYFVHSYRAFCDDDKNLTAYCDYGKSVIPALVSDGGSVFGTQFHPEKSGEYGLGILKRFGELK
jgi:imidazole glycerol phosphate synthase glutamine amidotransferase subunit